MRSAHPGSGKPELSTCAFEPQVGNASVFVFVLANCGVRYISRKAANGMSSVYDRVLGFKVRSLTVSSHVAPSSRAGARSLRGIFFFFIITAVKILQSAGSFKAVKK